MKKDMRACIFSIVKLLDGYSYAEIQTIMNIISNLIKRSVFKGPSKENIVTCIIREIGPTSAPSEAQQCKDQ